MRLVRFTQSAAPYSAGEQAGLTDRVAASMVKQGRAVYVDEASKGEAKVSTQTSSTANDSVPQRDGETRTTKPARGKSGRGKPKVTKQQE